MRALGKFLSFDGDASPVFYHTGDCGGEGRATHHLSDFRGRATYRARCLPSRYGEKQDRALEEGCPYYQG